MLYYEEPAKKLPVREFDVVIAGGGTAGVMAAIASARQGAKTALIELKATRAESSRKAARPCTASLTSGKRSPAWKSARW